MDTSGNTGVGLTNPGSFGKFAVAGGNIGVKLTSNTTASIDFWNAPGTKISQILYDDSNGNITIGSVAGGAYATIIQANGIERARFNNNGMGLGGAVPTSGTGITFPATQSASSDANCLDDYEEGTWTPYFGSTGTQPSVTYSSQSGRYTKIGNLVYVSFYVGISALSTAGTGNLIIPNLPFIATSTSYSGITPALYNFNWQGYSVVTIQAQVSTNYIGFLGTNNNGGWGVLQTSGLGSTTNMSGFLVYQTS